MRIGDKAIDVVTGNLVTYIEMYNGYVAPWYRSARVRFGDSYKVIRIRRLRQPMQGELRANKRSSVISGV